MQTCDISNNFVGVCRLNYVIFNEVQLLSFCFKLYVIIEKELYYAMGMVYHSAIT